MKPAGRPVLAAFKRAYAAQAQASKVAEKVTLAKQEPKITKLPNGAIVASIENNSPISRVAVTYQAGARVEKGSQLGITHCIRNAAHLSTERATGFGISRSVQQIGGNLGCTTTREHVVYSLECMRNSMDSCVEMLGHVATSPAFKPWEVTAANERLALDLAMFQQNPNAVLLEALHEAAFRDTLGRSLYMPQFKVGSFTPEALKAFVTENYTSGNMALVGVGVEHDQLLGYAKKLVTNNGAAPAVVPAKYYGGEVRVPSSSPLVHAAMVTEGPSMTDKDLVALYVLQQVMGTGPRVKYSSNVATSKVAKAAAQGTSSPFAATSLAATYSDSGLFGFYVVAPAAEVDKVLKSAAGTFAEATKGGITDADVQRGKVQLNAAMMMEMESQGLVLEDLAFQALVTGQVLTYQDLAQAISSLTTADIQNVAKKVINGKPSMAAVGDLSNTPYLDQLL